MRVDERVVSCGYVVWDDVVGFVGVVVCACTTAGAATMAAAAMNFRNMVLPPSMRFIDQLRAEVSCTKNSLNRVASEGPPGDTFVVLVTEKTLKKTTAARCVRFASSYL